MVRHFVPEPVVAYKVKKSGETDPALLALLERGRRYIDEFASRKMAKPDASGHEGDS